MEMRLDKYLKVSRLIKRRTIASEACNAGRVSVNNRTAKASTKVEPGDEIEITFGGGKTKIRVLEVSEHATKKNSNQLYEIVD